VCVLLIPFAVFAAAFCVGALALRHIAKGLKVSQTETRFGRALHVDSPLGTIDVHPEGKLDPRLAVIPLYPGAMPENAKAAESVTELHYGSRILQEISASYWTSDNVKQVWKFYRQMLPDWSRNLADARGKELIRDEKDCVLLIRITSQRDRTVIETSVKPRGYPNLFERGMPLENRVLPAVEQ